MDMLINNTNFTLNKAITGGVFYIEKNLNLTILNCNFENNLAEFKANIIFINSRHPVSTLIINNSIQKNDYTNKA